MRVPVQALMAIDLHRPPTVTSERAFLEEAAHRALGAQRRTRHLQRKRPHLTRRSGAHVQIPADARCVRAASREATKTIDGAIGPRTASRWLAALVMVFALVIAVIPGTAMAAAGWRQHQWHPRTADVTFTKWVVTLPTDPSTLAGIQMTGIVGGDVGQGLYRGRVLTDDTVTQPGFWLAHVRYDFFDHDHWLIADLHITEDDRGAPITATIKGIVAAGWMFGAQVTGQYTQWTTCPITTPGNVFGTTCFVGTLHLQGVLGVPPLPWTPDD